MAKKFSVEHIEGETQIVEAKSLNGAIKKSGYDLKNVVSVGAVKPAPTSWCKLIEGKKIKVALPGGAEMIGSEEQVNTVFTLMGYGEIKIAINMMSQGAYIEAVGTPGYCSPSSEAYWSM